MRTGRWRWLAVGVAVGTVPALARGLTAARGQGLWEVGGLPVTLDAIARAGVAPVLWGLVVGAFVEALAAGLRLQGRPGPVVAGAGVVAAAGWLVLAGAWVATARARRPSGPSVLLVVVDTLRADRVGAAGAARSLTPAVDALAARGVTHTQARATAPWTSPSVASLLTSRDPAELGYADSGAPIRLDDGVLTLAEIFRSNGYRTAAVVAHDYVGASLGFAQGFESFDEREARGHHHVSSPAVVDTAARRLRGFGDSPFFLLVHLFDPHFAYLAHEGHDTGVDPEYRGPVHDDLLYGDLLALVRGDFGPEDLAHVEARYDSEVAFTDAALARLFAAAEGVRPEADLLVVFTADHGEAFLDRADGWIGHGVTLHDELVRVPLVLAGAGHAGGRVIDEPVSLVDVAPTLVEALRLRLPAGHRHAGRVLTDVGGEPAASFMETRARRRWLEAVVLGDFKLVEDRVAGSRALFDLRADPGERRDIAAARPEVAERLAAVLAERRAALAGAAPGQPAALSDEQRERLRALGYVQ